jgi:hypothetical protein
MSEYLFLYDPIFDPERLKQVGQNIAEAIGKEVEVVYANLENTDEWKDYSCDGCVYFIPFDSGVTRAHSLPVITSQNNIPNWLIVMIPNELSNVTSFNVIKRKWEQVLFDTKCSVEVITMNFKDIEPVLNWIMSEIKLSGVIGSDRNSVCAVVSLRSYTGKSLLISQLKRKTSQWTFIEINSENLEDYILIKDKVSRIIILGTDITDFLIPPPSDGIRRAIFVLNKLDEQLLFRMNPGVTRKELYKYLLENKWSIPTKGEENIVLTSALYAQTSLDLLEGRISIDDIINDPEISCWDNYWLPVSKSDNRGSLVDFLKNNNGLENLIRVLNSSCQKQYCD